MPDHNLQSYVATAMEACGRWGIRFQVPADADDARAASIIRSAIMRAGKAAAASVPAPFYWDDNSWIHHGMHGVTLARIAEEQVVARNPTAESTDDWGIMARVSNGEYGFDIPVAISLDEDSARNILGLIEGKEQAFVNTDLLPAVMDGDISIFFHADNWAALRDLQKDMSIQMEDAMHLRRPAAWDILRARLSELPPEALPEFDEEAFYSRYARSVRYDVGLMDSNRRLVSSLSAMEVAPGSAKWGEWFPAVTDLLFSIGDPSPMDGMSVVLSFAVEEPLAVQPEEHLDVNHPDHTPFASWDPVGFHNLVVAFGLHPLSAIALHDLVAEDPEPFYDLPGEENRRFRLAGAMIVQDSMLSSLRASLTGRGPAYDAIVRSQNEMLAAKAERERPAEPEEDEGVGGITF